jgi:hypothetical protein
VPADFEQARQNWWIGEAVLADPQRMVALEDDECVAGVQRLGLRTAAASTAFGLMEGVERALRQGRAIAGEHPMSLTTTILTSLPRSQQPSLCWKRQRRCRKRRPSQTCSWREPERGR